MDSNWRSRAVPATESTNDWKSRAAVAPAPEVGQLESLGRGALQGATLGFSDEAIGGLEALWDKMSSDEKSKTFSDLYKQHRDESRAANKRAEEANPKSYMGGQLGGGLATALVPGLGEMNIAKMGALGATQAIGDSNADNVADLAKDAAIGGVTGAAVQGIGEKVLAPALSAAKGKIGELADTSLKKFGKVVANIPEEYTERYLQRPGEINKALDVEGVAQYLHDDALPQMREKLSGLSTDAWNTLNTAPTIDKAEALGVADLFKQELLKGPKGNLTRTAGTGGAADKINAVEGQLKQLMDAYGDKLSEADMKSIIQGLQSKGWAESGAPATSLSGEALADLSSEYNRFLKTRNPDYASAMEPVAQSTQALKDIEKNFINRTNPDDLSKAVRNLNRFDRVNQDSLNIMDDVAGTGFTDMAKDALVKQSFEKADTAGSRKTIAGAILGRAAEGALGGTIGYVAGDHSGTGAAVGAIAGMSMDKYAGKLVKGLLDASISGQQFANAFKNTKFATILSNAATRGNSALAATHFLLQQNDPNYRKTLNDMNGNPNGQ